MSAFVKRTIRDGHIAVITLGDGRSIEADYNQFSDDMKVAAGVHGAKQKIGDGTSSYSKAKDYDGAYAECCAIRDSIVNDSVWNRKGGGAGARDIVEAAHRVATAEGNEVTIEQVEESINLMDVATYDALCDDDRIKAAVKAIQAERAATKAETSKSTIDLTSLFASK